MKWSDEERRRCLQMVRQGKSQSEIAAALGRTKDGVQQYISRMRKIDPVAWKTHYRPKEVSTQKCWNCYFASGAEENGWKCPWAARLQPVEGWDATEVDYILHSTFYGYKRSRTYAIKDCPRFKEG